MRAGFSATVRLDACRAIDLGGSLEAMKRVMAQAGVTLA
jgi:nicotinamidase/pyrazinamidase